MGTSAHRNPCRSAPVRTSLGTSYRAQERNHIVSLGGVSVSSAARRRIRFFSVYVWIAGTVLMAIVAFNTYARLGFGDGGFQLLGRAANPWQQAEPVVFDNPEDDKYSGTGSGVIRVPLAEHDREPYEIVLRQGRYVDFFVTPVDELDLPAGEGWPANIAYLYDPGDTALVLPGDGDLELWVRADGDWEFSLTTIEVDEIVNGFASGTGDAFLVFRGDAVSARAVHKGEGIFFVTIQTVGGVPDRPVTDTGDIDERVSWNPTEAVYFTIEADEERGAWSIDIDELATDAPQQPTPDPAPAEPTPTPAAASPLAPQRTTPTSRTRGKPSV